MWLSRGKLLMQAVTARAQQALSLSEWGLAMDTSEEQFDIILLETPNGQWHLIAIGGNECEWKQGLSL